MAKYEVTGNILGVKRGSVVEFEGALPRPYAGRVRKLPDNLQAKPVGKAAQGTQSKKQHPAPARRGTNSATRHRMLTVNEVTEYLAQMDQSVPAAMGE